MARSKRQAHNQALFREVNENIAEVWAGFEVGTQAFFCECSQAGCTEMIDLPAEVYERIRTDPSHFLVRPGHQDPAQELIIEGLSDYLIVEARPGTVSVAQDGSAIPLIRVLVADDSAEYLAAVAEVIAASEGFELAGRASNGEEAVELARLGRPDLALIDVNMPGIGGRAAAAQIATTCPETAVVLMTAALARSTASPAVFDKRRLSPTTLAEVWDHARATDEPEDLTAAG